MHHLNLIIPKQMFDPTYSHSSIFKIYSNLIHFDRYTTVVGVEQTLRFGVESKISDLGSNQIGCVIGLILIKSPSYCPKQMVGLSMYIERIALVLNR